MAKGILKISKTNRGKIFVELDRLNGKPPMPLSYVVIPDTSLSGKECEYKMDKGICMSISVDGAVVWERTPAPSQNIEQRAVQGVPAPGGSKFRDSLSIADTFLPRDVRNNKGLLDIDNFSLKLQKAARYEAGRDTYKFTFFKNDQREKTYFEIKANYGHLTNNFEALCKRQTNQAERLFPGNNRPIALPLRSKMILGLGGESVYETSMTLHHVYGIPYLPSPSIKGVLRSWVISQVFAKLSNIPVEERDFPLVNAEYRAITTSKLFCLIFGCPENAQRVIFIDKKPKQRSKKERDYAYDPEETPNALAKANRNLAVKQDSDKAYQGCVTFFDGLPTVAPIIKTDVMNVHYKDWYNDSGYKAPTDTQRTNPILFLTVSNENKLQFQTNIATDRDIRLREIGENLDPYIADSKGKLTADSSLLDLVAYWLKKAMTEHGVGAKTAVGYGLMDE